MLTGRMKIFVNEYLKCRVATEAARKAGYPDPRCKGSKLLKHPEVKKLIEEVESKEQSAALVEVDYIINNLKEIVERCMQRSPVMVFDRAEKQMVQAVDDDGNNMWEFDSAGANKALELLGKYRKIFTDKVEVDVLDNLAQQLTEARERFHAHKASKQA
jgi:phage terminase small subunit